MQKIHKLVQRIADTDATVLITGESGTGKEVVARTIHMSSPRADRPFVPINCAAVPHDLLESELFGHERGAFTGAVNSRVGLFQLAEGGTLFLDEVGELSLSLQAKLLRVLQSGEIRPIGAAETKTLNVRIIAATNKDIARSVETGTFREDLFYRLEVIPIHLPPLRARRSDIPLLVNFFLERFNRKYGTSATIASEANIYLWEYDWPGNVRELENTIERMVILNENGRIDLEALPSNIRTFVSDKKVPQPTFNKELDFRAALKQFEYRLIDEALRLTDGNKAMAARMLKLKRTTLVAKLRTRDARRETNANYTACSLS
ncbi:MAG: sigma-54-dependent Fis family transcriptional regulator [Deltaproteobacteria bacterium]|nr:sigma-54-dependent Fis family transcriptional regulator [Deltaproteobacteria bacterium]